MKNSIIKRILTATVIFAVVVFVLWSLKEGIDKSEKVRCLELKSQAVEFPRTYSQWAKENPKAHSEDVKWCSEQYNVEIVLN